MTPLLRRACDAGAALRLHRVSINLMCAETLRNDPFYEKMVREFYDSTRRRHRKLPLIRAFEFGVALCALPKTFDEYFMMIEAAARRNFKKASRLGYVARRIDFNSYMDDIREIRGSTDNRQGRLSDDLLNGEVKPRVDPPSRTNIHDYPCFGILRENKLFAYATCFVSGELGMIDHILGHARCQDDGIVPMLIISIAGELLAGYPHVKFYAFGTFFGCAVGMRRFKRKFGFLPHRVDWQLG